jgi:RNA polymerase sigma-70 factor (ECF subfamily)
MSAPAPAPESLLAHTGWMRRLARSLVRDDAQADDVVQDAMAAALRSPPRDAVALPAWLAATVRNAARQVWRGESRRAAREMASARPEAQPGAAEVVARAEEHGLVVQAVLALEEPYRAAVLLRFFDDLPPREVARRTGVPVETARARVRRGIEQLRGRLDRAHGGDGRAWRLALVPLALDRAGAATSGAGGGAAGTHFTTGALTMAGGAVTAAVGGLALVVGIAVGWYSGGSKSDAAAADAAKQAEAAHAAQTSAESEKESLRQTVARLEGALRDAQAKARESDKQIAGLRDELAAKPAPAQLVAAEPAAAMSAKGPRFAFGQFGKLGEVDWKGVGEHLNAISPICAEIGEAIAKGEDYTALQGKAAQHNGYLINAAVKILGQVPGTGVNGSFTHPAFQVNAIAAALEAAGKPLTPEQATALEKLAREYSDEDARRLQGYGETTFGVRKVIEEADVRARFFDAAFAAISESQRDTLTPPATRGILGLDLYSDGLLWITVMRPVPFKDTAALGDTVTAQLQSGMKIGKEQTEALRAVVNRWVADLPASLVDTPDPSGARGRMHVTTVRLAAAKTLALAESVVADLKLEGAAAAAARRWTATIVPVRGED